MLTNILLTAVLVALIILIVLARRRAPLEPNIGSELGAAIERLGAAARHHADVSAVVEMVRQLDADPDALELIKSYPETIRAAAWLHYINSLGATLQSLQDNEARVRREGYMTMADNCQSQVAAVREQLDAAIAASGQSGLRSV